MTPSEQRIAIATHCGWKRSDKAEGPVSADRQHWVRPGGDVTNHRAQSRLPNYPADLNALFDAIRAQPNDVQWAIFTELAHIVEADRPAAFGTAKQYSEALCRTLWPERWTRLTSHR